MTEQSMTYAAQPEPTSSYAEWGDRAVAWLWDFLYMWPTWVAFFGSTAVLVVGLVAHDNNPDDGNVLVGVGIAALLLSGAWSVVRMVRNSMVRQGRTGQTWGKAKVGIWVVHARTGAVPGVGSCVARYFLHRIINQAVYIDYLWPLWDDRKQTLTDKVLDTVVIRAAVS